MSIKGEEFPFGERGGVPLAISGEEFPPYGRRSVSHPKGEPHRAPGLRGLHHRVFACYVCPDFVYLLIVTAFT